MRGLGCAEPWGCSLLSPPQLISMRKQPQIPSQESQRPFCPGQTPHAQQHWGNYNGCGKHRNCCSLWGALGFGGMLLLPRGWGVCLLKKYFKQTFITEDGRRKKKSQPLNCTDWGLFLFKIN